jgi:hypothetical protein
MEDIMMTIIYKIASVKARETASMYKIERVEEFNFQAQIYKDDELIGLSPAEAIEKYREQAQARIFSLVTQAEGIVAEINQLDQLE